MEKEDIQQAEMISMFCKGAIRNYSKHGLISAMPFRKKGDISIRIKRKGDEKFSFIPFKNGMKTSEDVEEAENAIRHYLFEL
jgi:two-component sensor histidine kinase